MISTAVFKEQKLKIEKLKNQSLYPPASKVSREVANLTEEKNPHTPVYGVKQFIFFWQSMGTQNGNFTKDYKWNRSKMKRILIFYLCLSYFSPIVASKQTFLINTPFF